MAIATLIVDDDDGLRPSLVRSFERRGHDVFGARTVAEARHQLQERRVDLALLDLRLPDGSGLELLAVARELDSEIAVIMMTSFPEVKTAVRAMKEGARDFIVKPFELEELHLTVERALETRELRRNVDRLERERGIRDEGAELVGESPAMERLRQQIRQVAPAPTPVLVCGETGTGKELVTDLIHRWSPRASGPLVKVNCSAVSDQLLESELFGHEKGAFTDAKTARAGLFEMAEGGTLFLDEISEMKLGLQAKLLRVLDGQPFRRVGGQREIRPNARVVAATNRDLKARARAGEFREDLYFRLNVFEVRLPPLRERGRDTVLLARHLLTRAAAALRKGPLRLSAAAEDMLLACGWPGNVRELRNVMERAAIVCESGEVDVEHLPGELQAAAFVRGQTAKGSGAVPSLAEVERRYIAQVVEGAGGNLSEAARLLGIARNTLKARLHLPDEEG